MATWVSHLIVADKVLEKAPWLCRREFCVGNIAPDCNIENGDFTSFTPPREVTHWMRGKHKLLCDAERFLEELVKPREAMAEKELSFLLGYYTHLVTDAEYHRFAIDGERICAAMQRIMACPPLAKKASGKENSWETVKGLIPVGERRKDICSIEKRYLERNPGSGYLTEILPLEEFPDYVSFLPHGAIARKVKVLCYMPEEEKSEFPYIAISEREYLIFLENAAEIALNGIISYKRTIDNSYQATKKT